jgi:hypothetical protein
LTAMCRQPLLIAGCASSIGDRASLIFAVLCDLQRDRPMVRKRRRSGTDLLHQQIKPWDLGPQRRARPPIKIECRSAINRPCPGALKGTDPKAHGLSARRKAAPFVVSPGFSTHSDISSPPDLWNHKSHHQARARAELRRLLVAVAFTGDGLSAIGTISRAAS